MVRPGKEVVIPAFTFSATASDLLRYPGPPAFPRERFNSL
ncbi:hypothetical protein ASZ90_011273 [hydrocarbon metagenome]|uniref:Uncharacterized protein n=1 Tax=hydrocarbon metagenome TaxID=938273 RepID=A0A0W8FDU3_9ZZZZ